MIYGSHFGCDGSQKQIVSTDLPYREHSLTACATLGERFPVSQATSVLFATCSCRAASSCVKPAFTRAAESVILRLSGVFQTSMMIPHDRFLIGQLKGYHTLGEITRRNERFLLDQNAYHKDFSQIASGSCPNHKNGIEYSIWTSVCCLCGRRKGSIWEMRSISESSLSIGWLIICVGTGRTRWI